MRDFRGALAALAVSPLLLVACGGSASTGHSAPEATGGSAITSDGTPENTVGGVDDSDPGADEPFDFTTDPIDGDELPSYERLLAAVEQAAVSDHVTVDMFDYGSWAPKGSRFYFNRTALAVVTPEPIAVLETVGKLTAGAADAYIRQDNEVHTVPRSFRADLDAQVACMVTYSSISTELMCGGSTSIIVDFIAPPVNVGGRAPALAALQDRARALYATKFSVSGS